MTLDTHANHDEQAGHSHGGHGWMMIACCIPMLVIAVVLVATGVAGVGFIFAAIACTLMMALMMRGMHGGGEGRK
jgi:Flp pilus assembly protein TadB